MNKFSRTSLPERRAVACGVIEPILTGLRDRKVAGTYKRLAPGMDERIHTFLSPDTASFRFSSSDSPLYPNSTNLQNLEKKVSKLDQLYRVRDIIMPAPGMVFLAGDYSGAEAIGCAAYSRDWTYLDKLLAGLDTHTELAIAFWGECDPLKRDVAKTIKYASSYVAKVMTVTTNLNKEADQLGRYFTQEEVHGYLQTLYTLHPLQRWWREVRDELEKHDGAIRNCFGYRRTFHDPNPDNRLKDACSFLPQSTVAWLMNRAIALIFRHVDKPGARELLHQIHDELLFQCYEDEIPFIVQTATPILELPFKVHGRELHIPVEWKWSRTSWGEMKLLETSAS